MKHALYPWQEDCLEKWFANNGRGIVQAVTGSGKTVLALEAVERLEKKTGKRVLVKIVVPTKALMQQWSSALRSFFENKRNEEIGLRGGGRKSPSNRRYMIYVVNSARYELARQILSDLKNGEQVFLIADECHHYVSGENQLIFEFFPYIKQYESQFFAMGLSATMPLGQAGKDLTAVLGRRICNYGIKKALEAQTVCGYDIYHIEVSLLPEERDEYEKLTSDMLILYRKLLKRNPGLHGKNKKELYEELRVIAGNKKSAGAKEAALYMSLSYKRQSTVCLAAARNRCAFHLIEMLGIQQKIIVFGERINQAEELYRMLQEHFPGKVGRYHSQMGSQANKNALERFRHGESRILVACKSMDEGIDVPDASVGIILSGTSVQRQRTQRLGRIIRRADGKKRASLYYLHAAETSEDQCFLPAAETSRIFELEYDSETGRFGHDDYDRAAEIVFHRMSRKNNSTKVQQEIARCLYKGKIRADWKLDENEIRKRIEEADSVRDKNYWICMQKLARIQVCKGRIERQIEKMTRLMGGDGELKW
ncbi:MAG: DEAD/DEAH box helicase [Lachnospiraceae bacterium]|nr:DEAD/DEAH box helicase [Lachnospiraceae bacterium]